MASVGKADAASASPTHEGMSHGAAHRDDKAAMAGTYERIEMRQTSIWKFGGRIVDHVGAT